MSQRSILLVTVAAGVLLNPLNSSMIALALLELQKQYDLSFKDSTWLISVFYLTSAIAQPIMGKAADLFGRKRLFIIGLLMVGLSSLMAPFSPSFAWLLAFRIIQAAGSSIIYPAGFGLVRHYITERQAGALGFLSVATSLAAATGPTIGGVLTQYLSWHFIFLVNIPFIAFALIFALRYLPNDSKHLPEAETGMNKSKASRFWSSIDIPGILFFSAFILSFLLFLLSLESHFHVAYFAAAALAGLLFVWQEKRTKLPFINVSKLAANRNLSFVYLQYILANIIYYSVFFGFPPYMQEVYRMSYDKAGALMFILSGVGILISPLSGRMIDRFGTRPALFCSWAGFASGTLILFFFQSSSSILMIVAVMILFGVGAIMSSISLHTSLYVFSPASEISSSTGLFATSRFLGSILSSSLLSFSFNAEISPERMRIIAICFAVLCAVIFVITSKMSNSTNEQIETKTA